MKGSIIIIGILAILMAWLVPLTPVISDDQSTNAPRIHVKNGTSTNWSGYAAFDQTGYDSSKISPVLATGTITYVAGTWTVPTASSINTTGNTYSSAWVGIDGYTSNTVEQLGTEQDIYNGQPRYYAWYEMYPKASQLIKGFTVQPGDTITASVTYSLSKGNGTFTLAMTSSRKHQNFTTSQKANNQMVRSSAEWIIEAPWSGGVLPLTNFGTINFSNCSFKSNSNTNQSIPTTQATTTTTGWVSDRIDMGSSSTALKDQTSGLNSTNNGFSVQWLSSN